MTIIFETDIGALTEPQTAEKLLEQGMYSDGSSLKTVLEPEVYRKLAEALDEYMIPMESVKYFKPGMLASTLSALSSQETGTGREGVDVYFYTKAVESGKKIHYLEPVDVQINALVNMGAGNENEFILYTLRDIDDSAEKFLILIDEWRKGGSLTMEEALKELEADFPVTYEEIAAGRNRLWLKKIRKYLQSSGTEFILFGTLHLHGKDGILHLLRAEGYEVEQLILEEADANFYPDD